MVSSSGNSNTTNMAFLGIQVKFGELVGESVSGYRCRYLPLISSHVDGVVDYAWQACQVVRGDQETGGVGITGVYTKRIFSGEVGITFKTGILVDIVRISSKEVRTACSGKSPSTSLYVVVVKIRLRQKIPQIYLVCVATILGVVVQDVVDEHGHNGILAVKPPPPPPSQWFATMVLLT